MEELKNVDVVFDFLYRAVELQGVIDEVLQCIAIDVLAEERISHCVGDVLKLYVCHVIEECLWQLIYTFRHIKTAVFSQSLYYCLLQVGYGSLSVCAIVLHIVSDLKSALDFV